MEDNTNIGCHRLWNCKNTENMSLIKMLKIAIFGIVEKKIVIDNGAPS